MIHRALCALAVALAVATGLLTNPSVASAHHPTITAAVVCDVETGVMSINFTSTAWEGEGSDPTNDPSRANSQIDIRLDGVTATSGAYVAPTYSFSGSLPIPAGKVAGDVVEVSALAVGTWGNGDTTHESTWVDVTIPNLACGDDSLRPAAVEQPGGQLGWKQVPHDRAPDDGRVLG